MPSNPSPIDVHILETVWSYAEPFVISRGALLTCDALELVLTDADGRTGRAEAYGVPYEGETPATMRAQIEALADCLRMGIDRLELMNRLPIGGARCAIDIALWDLEAKQGLGDPFRRHGLEPLPVRTAYTLGMRAAKEFASAAKRVSACSWIKVKVGADDALEAVEAVHRGAPNAALIVDPNQAWSGDQLRSYAPRMANLGVRLLEQPLLAEEEQSLDGYACPIPLCADESFNGVEDLPRVVGRYQVVNIKLDKVGGLTAAMQLASAALAAGLDLMVGCMGGTSLAMAPGMVLAQRSRYVDLDGPRLLSQDRQHRFQFRDGVVEPSYIPQLWG